MSCAVLNAGQTRDWLDLSSNYTLLTHSASVPKSSDHHLTWPDWDTPTTTTGFGKHLMRSSRPVHPMLKTGPRSDASLRRSSLKQQKAVMGPKKHKHQDWCDENDECITQLLHAKNQTYIEWHNDPSSKSKQTNSDISEDNPRRDYPWCKTTGGRERQMKCKCMQTQTTPNNSSELWRLYTGPHKLDWPLYYQLMDEHWSRTKMLWENDR